MVDSGMAHAKEYFPELLLPVSLSPRKYWNKNEDVPSSELEALMSISFLTALAFSGNWETGGSGGGASLCWEQLNHTEDIQPNNTRKLGWVP
ncbi:hypothetical protein J1605_016169 [Eschrichtius robustus]|uniref:Uncharacterized protein n=1 Tax=Eschrichtius robustus TaxID=9764 RepID=A0AB34G7T2_ESCRO|nr:hypothetical protein J1605_016169 [Eschrichtius robustus]